MNCFTVTTILLVVTSCFLDRTVTGKSNKLQIGVKKKVQDCQMRARNGDEVHIEYTGKLENGQVFDSTSIALKEPYVFTLGVGQVIKGWDLGVWNMCQGEKRKIVVPPALGYGDDGSPPNVPGN